MFDQENIEDNSNEEMPAPPSAPPLAPALHLSAAPDPALFYRKEDLKLKEILESAELPTEKSKRLLEYQAELRTQLSDKTAEVLRHQRSKDMTQTQYDINKCNLQRIPQQIIEFQERIRVLSEVSEIAEEQRQKFFKLFNVKLKLYQQNNKDCIDDEKRLKQTLEEKNEALSQAIKEKDQIDSKLKRLKRAIDTVEKAGYIDAAIPEEKSFVDIPKKATIVHSYEDELRSKGDIFCLIKATKIRKTIHPPKTILALQCAIFEEADWDGDCEQILQDRLWSAIVLRKHEVKELYDAPRANIRKILGYDIIEEYESRETLKKQTLNAKITEKQSQREINIPQESASSTSTEAEDNRGRIEIQQERKEVIEKEIALSAPISENIADQSQGSQKQKVVQSRKRIRSPDRTMLITELRTKQQLLQEAQEAKLKAEQEAQKEREIRNRLEAELLKAKSLPRSPAKTLLPSDSKAKAAWEQRKKRY